MIIVLKPSTAPEQLLTFTEKLKNDYGVRINRWDGVHSTVLGLIGDTTQVDIEYIEAQDIVESVKRVQEPYKKANPSACRSHTKRQTASFIPKTPPSGSATP